MSVQTCPACGADPKTIGIVEGHPCLECVHREDMEGVTFGDRDFGTGVRGMIAEECYKLRDLLLEKNKNYGNAALEPVRIFSKASPIEQILVRLDDKLSRLARGHAAGEDVELDLMGYLILLRVARRLEAGKEP